MRNLGKFSIAVFFMFGASAGTVLGQRVASADQLTVDQIVERYIEALGGREKIKALQNIVYSGGLYEEGDYRKDDATMSVGRPSYKLVGDKNQPGGYMEGYDGAAWEWFKDPGVVIRTDGNPSAAMRHYAGVERPLVDYRAKGSVANIKGESEFDGKAVFAIHLTRRDGYVEQFYIDKDTYLVVASGGEAPIHAFGDAVTHLTRISDYRSVSGVLTAHRFETVELPSGRAMDSMQWGKIEANVDLPPDWFSPPEFERTPLQAFIEQLYGQRADTPSVMWTYDEFRLAYPGVDTSEAVNIAGFQTLKMGVVDGAIVLLERNALAYPGSADARFGLGRAYGTAGRNEDAREQYDAALEIDPDHRRSKAALESIKRR